MISDIQREFQETKLKIGSLVKFPKKRENPDDVGIVKKAHLQPAIEWNDDDYCDARDLEMQRMGYKGEKSTPISLGPEILCNVQFSDCVHVTAPGDLIWLTPSVTPPTRKEKLFAPVLAFAMRAKRRLSR